MLDATELADVWEACARRRAHITTEDVKTIRETAHMYLRIIDMNGNGLIDYQEFFVFMLGGMEERGPLKNMRDRLARNPAKTQEIIQRFLKWDVDGDGFVTRSELAAHLGEIEELSGGQTGKAGEQLIDEMLKAGDVDGDGRFDLWEIAAHTLGRRKTPVELLIYDISNGLSSKLSPLLLGRHFEAIYHTSVVVFGEEYWFGGKIFKNSPPCTRCFGRPLTRSRVRLEASEYFPDLRVVRMGHTLATSEEFHRHLDLETRLDFTPASYDILTHNCNSFTNEAMMFLTGHGIPEEIKRLPELVTNTPTVKLLRPFLNRWLGGFDAYDSQENGFLDVGSHGFDIRMPNLNDVASSVLGQEVVIKADVVGDAAASSLVACVTREDHDTVDVKYFDPNTCAFVRQTGLRRSDVMTTSQHRLATGPVRL